MSLQKLNNQYPIASDLGNSQASNEPSQLRQQRLALLAKVRAQQEQTLPALSEEKIARQRALVQLAKARSLRAQILAKHSETGRKLMRIAHYPIGVTAYVLTRKTGN